MSKPEYPCPTCKTQPGVPLPTGVVDCERCYQSKKVLSASTTSPGPSWTETWRKAVTSYWDDDEDTV